MKKKKKGVPINSSIDLPFGAENTTFPVTLSLNSIGSESPFVASDKNQSERKKEKTRKDKRR